MYRGYKGVQFQGSPAFLLVTECTGVARDVRRRSIVKANAFRTIDRANEPLPVPNRSRDLVTDTKCFVCQEEGVRSGCGLGSVTMAHRCSKMFYIAFVRS